jgi:hypothetical protein
MSSDEDAANHHKRKKEDYGFVNTSISHIPRNSNDPNDTETTAQNYFNKDHTYMASHSQIIIEDSQEDAITGYTQNSASAKQMTGNQHLKRVSTGYNDSQHLQEKINEKNWSKQQVTNDLQNVTLNFADSMELLDNFQGELDPCQMTKNSGMAFG